MTKKDAFIQVPLTSPAIIHRAYYIFLKKKKQYAIAETSTKSIDDAVNKAWDKIKKRFKDTKSLVARTEMPKEYTDYLKPYKK